MDSMDEQRVLELAIALCRELDTGLQDHLEMTSRAITGSVQREYSALVQYTEEQIKGLLDDLKILYNERIVM